MAPSLVILGWDSATFDVIDPLVEAGRLPVLRALGASGFAARARSTWPPMTDCAWTSAFTGVNPGVHGIFGSWYRAPGAYECRYFSSRDRLAPALWELTDGVRHLVWNVPMTFPPAAVDGVMVAGYGAPPGSAFCEPASFQDALRARWPLEELLDRAPRGSLERFLDELLRGLDAQAEALVWAAKETGADCISAVWPQVDRAQHFFWQFRGTDHPLADAIDRVYEAIDRATGVVVEELSTADVIVVSDHGAGPLQGDVNLGAWLAANGYAQYGAAKTSRALSAAWALPAPIRRFAKKLAPALARRTMQQTLTGRLGSFEWRETRAFLGFHGDLWLNLKGREADGIVDPAAADALLDELSESLLALDDPRSGKPVLAGTHKRAEIYHGPAVALAPDLMLDSWSAGYRVAPGREQSEEVVVAPAALAGVDEAWSADHRPVGIFVAAGPRISAASAAEVSLYDVCPTALALLDQPVPPELDGRAALDAIDESWLANHPIRERGEEVAVSRSRGVYSEEEAAAVAAHLKDLGYIE